jgi:hypothetical protein
MIRLRYLGGLSLLILLLSITSCYKVKSTHATIIVTDKNGNVLPGTSIRVFPSPTQPPDPPAELNQSLDETKIADGNGRVFFDYSEYYKRGQVGLFVLNIEATSGDTLMVPGIIKVTEQADNYETIKFPFEL